MKRSTKGFTSAWEVASRRQVFQVYLNVEVTAVGQNGPVLHHLEVLPSQHAGAAGNGDEDIAQRSGIRQRHDTKALHNGLQRADGIDLHHDDLGAHAPGARGNAAAAPAVTAHHNLLAGPQDVGGPRDAVQGTLPGAEPVIKEVLRIGVVHCDDGVGERAGSGHAAQADNAGGRLFAAANEVGQQVRAGSGAAWRLGPPRRPL